MRKLQEFQDAAEPARQPPQPASSVASAPLALVKLSCVSFSDMER